MPRDQVEQALAGFLDSPTWSAFAGMSPAGSAADPAETEDLEFSNERREPSQGLRGLLYYIAEEDAKRKAYEHRGIICEECREQPIRGVRWYVRAPLPTLDASRGAAEARVQRKTDDLFLM